MTKAGDCRQKKLVELGRVLMLDPRCILLDEPFAGVNPVLIDEICDRVRELNGKVAFIASSTICRRSKRCPTA